MVAQTVYLPDTVEVGAIAKLIDYSIIQTSDTELEYRKKRTPLVRRAWTISWHSMIDEANVPDVEAMFEALGTHTSFLFWPPRERDRYEAQQALRNTVTGSSTGDGSTLIFQLMITRTVGSVSGSKKVMHPKTGTVEVYVNGVLKTEGVHYGVGSNTGIVTFTDGNAPPNGQLVSAAFEYYTPVRFMSDEVETTIMIATDDNLLEQVNRTAIIEVFDE
jgi:uncharacterized protein (TIGR02217 family)